MDKKGNIVFLILGIACLLFATLAIGDESRDEACREIGYDEWDVAEITTMHDEVGITTYENICSERDEYAVIELDCDFLIFNCRAFER